MLPANAHAGECYARVFVPPQHVKETKRVLKREASEKIETVAEKYEWIEKKVLIKEESEKIEVIPAQFETVEEKVLIKPAGKKLTTEPAEYKEVEEKVLVKAGYTTWKKGRGPIQKVNDATGEIMCLVDVPPEYKVIKKQVLAKPSSVKTVEVPAEYKWVKKQVLVEPAKTQVVKVPAEYDVIKVQTLVDEAKEVRTPIPAEYEDVIEVKKATDGQMEWRAILCETNTTVEIIKKLQGALRSAGYEPGPMDGSLGWQTMAAVKKYQEAKGLPSGQLTMETLHQLGIMDTPQG